MFRVPRHFTALPLHVRHVAASAADAVANAVASTSAKRTLVLRFILMSFSFSRFLLLSLQFRCVRDDRLVVALLRDHAGRWRCLLTTPVEPAGGLLEEVARDAQPLRVQVRLQGLRETREVQWSAAGERLQAAVD